MTSPSNSTFSSFATAISVAEGSETGRLRRPLGVALAGLAPARKQRASARPGTAAVVVAVLVAGALAAAGVGAVERLGAEGLRGLGEVRAVAADRRGHVVVPDLRGQAPAVDLDPVHVEHRDLRVGIAHPH